MKLHLLSFLLFFSPLAWATNFTVTNLNNSGAGSFRQAVLDANADNTATSGDLHTIVFTGLSGTIQLSSEVTVANHIGISGPSTGTLILEGNSSNIMTINSGFTVQIAYLTFKDATKTTGGGAIQNSGSNVSITFCTFDGNQTTGSAQGGAIWTGQSGTMSISKSTFKNNTSGNTGGAIANYATLSLSNCTFFGNTSGVNGGALINYSETSIVNCTFASNSFGGVTNGTTAGLTALNSIFLGTISGDDIHGNVTAAYCIYKTTSGGTVTGTSNITTASLSDVFGSNTLADNGGVTETIAILNPGPAVNEGISSGAPTTDQIGQVRVGAVDIGSFESQGPATAIADAKLGNSIKVSSNPGNGNFYVELSDVKGIIEFYETDLKGVTILTMKSEANVNVVKIDLQKYPSGCYLLTVVDGDRKAVKQLIKE